MLAITVNTDRSSTTSDFIDRHWDASSSKRLVTQRRRGIPKYVDSPGLRTEHDNAALRHDLAVSASHFRF